jgi:alpha-amylase
MGTKGGADGIVHEHFSPFESPYAAFVAYMNVLRDFVRRVDGKPVEQLV